MRDVLYTSTPRLRRCTTTAPVTVLVAVSEVHVARPSYSLRWYHSSDRSRRMQSDNVQEATSLMQEPPSSRQRAVDNVRTTCNVQ